MRLTQQRATDVAFVVGLATAPIWCGAQIYSAFTSMNGVSLAQYLAFVASFVLGFTLAVEANMTRPGRVIRQQIMAHGSWSVGSIILVAVVLVHGNYRWTGTDTTLGFTVLAGVVTAVAWKVANGRDMNDPAVRGMVSISLKSLPQFLLVAKIWSEGGAGYHWSAILTGNVSILSRLLPLFVSISNEGMNRAKWWLLVQDALNEVSWGAISIVWFIR